MATAKQKIRMIAQILSANEAHTFVVRLKEYLTDIGLEHFETCMSQKPHSHTSDCNCGIDEIQDTVLSIINRK